MYDENKWNENENKETVIDGTARIVEETANESNAEHSNGHYPYGGQAHQSGSYQSNPNGANSQNRQPYNNQYNYYQNSNMNRSQQSGGTGNAPKKKGSFFKKTLLITAAALLFGVVSGATMFGVNRAGELLFPMPVETQVQPETSEALGNTDVVEIPQQTEPVQATGVVLEDVSLIVEAAMPSVVAINNTTLYQSSTWFGQTQTYEVPSSGSGIIIGENETELLIVTNNHVIEDSNTLSVTFIDESTVNAAIKGTDSASDLAVIAVPLDDIAADTKAQIKAATLGDSDALKMGQGVIAIGNALGHGQSVTVGHVSALDREIQVDGNTKTVIQTDAAINPGNSGGALLNSKGELIGINEAKYADEKVEGVGYAIPISYAKDIIEDLKLRVTKVEVSESEQGYLGIQVQNVDSTTAQMLGMPEGVYVYKIMEDSAAASSELREKDIITKFDGETVRTNADLTELLTYYKAGTTVTVTVQSLENGTYVERQVEITLKNRPKESEEDAQSQNQRIPRP
ncbi:MAG: trypsin-like peptidase domain-containing protein [Lachnospiraceae bacterium]|nr:trypsin-like peptidase domain-containing protein [Lachnospiraceae bacterium]